MAYWNPPGQSRFPQIYIPYQDGRTNASPDYFETLSWEQTPNEELRSYYDNELFNRFMYYEPMQNQNIDLQNSMNEFKGLQFLGNRNPLTTQPRSYDFNFNSTSDSGPSFGSTSGGGMSKDPRAYIEAAKDIATWTADIVDSSRSKMGLPALRQYHPETIRDVESYGMMKRGPLLGRSLADVDKPRFGSSFLDVNKKSIKGAMDGWNISNNWIGAVVGGVIGAGMGVGNALTKLKTYNENLRRLTRQDKMQTQNFLAGQNTGYRNIRSNVKSSMNRQRLSSNYALGGQIDNEEIMGITKYGAGGTHEENPNGGVQVGIGDNGRPNLVEEGEVRWNDFIFSQRVKPTEEVLRKYNTFMRGGYTSYAELAEQILKLHEGRENSPFDRASLQVQMQRLADAQEFQKSIEQQQATQEQMIMPQQQLYAYGGSIGMPDANYFAEGGGDDEKYYNIKGKKQVQANQPVNHGTYKTIPIYSDQPGNPMHGPTEFSRKTATQNDYTMIWTIRKFAGSWQRFNDAAKNLQTQLNQHRDVQNNIMTNIGDINAMSAENLEYLYALTSHEDRNLASVVQNYINAYCELDRSLLAAQNVFAWAQVYDANYYGKDGYSNKGIDKEHNKTYQFSRYLSEIGHFDGRDPIKEWNSNYIIEKIIKGDSDYAKCVDAMEKYNKTAPMLFALYSREGSQTPFNFSNKNLFRRRFTIPSDFDNTDFTAGGLPMPSTSSSASTNTPSATTLDDGTNVSARTTSSSVPRTASNTLSVVSSIRPPRYYDMATGKYVENDPTNPNILTITGDGSNGAKSFDGTIVYNAANNNSYYDKYRSLNNDDFENILSNLKRKYPGRYDSYTIDDVKRGGGDNQFGNIHKEIGLYQKPVSDQVQNNEAPLESSNNQDAQTNGNATEPSSRFDDVEMDLEEDLNPQPKDWRQYIYRGMMAAPILDNLRSILTQDPPDYTYANQLASLYRPATYRPIGRYQRFMPSDTHYLDTQARQSTNTLLGHYKNNPISSSASDYFATLASTVGGTNAARQYLTALRQDNAERNAALAFNNQVDAANENARRSTLGSNIQNYANIMAQSYAAAEQERLAVENAIENNYMNLATNIGELGHEWYDRWRVDKTPYYSYDSNLDYNGRLVYVPQSYPQSNGKRKSKD